MLVKTVQIVRASTDMKHLVYRGMNYSVPNRTMCFKDFLYPICIVLWLYRILTSDVPIVLTHASLIFNYYVMQDDATCHDLS